MCQLCAGLCGARAGAAGRGRWQSLMSPADPDAIHAAAKFCRATLARELRPLLEGIVSLGQACDALLNRSPRGRWDQWPRHCSGCAPTADAVAPERKTKQQGCPGLHERPFLLSGLLRCLSACAMREPGCSRGGIQPRPQEQTRSPQRRTWSAAPLPSQPPFAAPRLGLLSFRTVA